MNEQLTLNNKPATEKADNNNSEQSIDEMIEEEFASNSFEKIEAKIDNSIELGKKAGAFLNKLNKESLWTKEKDYDYKNKDSSDLKTEKKIIKLYKEDKEREISESETCQEIQKSYFEESKKPVHEFNDGSQFIKF